MNNEQFIFSNLARHPEYYDDVINLIEVEFHYQTEFHFEIDFAPLVDPLNFENCLIAIDKNSNQVVSHLGFCNREMIKNNITIPVCFVGGIVTRKEFRGKKLFRNLMNIAISQNENKVGLFFLWSDIQGLYEKFNFYLSGGIFRAGKNIITKENIPIGFYKTTFSDLTEKEFNELKKLYVNSIEKHFFTLHRKETHWAIIRKMKSIDLFIEKDINGKIITYLCQGKGRDLQGVIHEFAALDLDSTIDKLSQYQIWLPEYFGEKSSNPAYQYTAFIKIGSKKFLNDFLVNISHNQFTLRNNQNNDIEFTYLNNSYNVSQKDFLQYLFGPKPLFEFYNFKLSPYISGADSV